jgi:hypothetical protein
VALRDVVAVGGARQASELARVDELARGGGLLSSASVAPWRGCVRSSISTKRVTVPFYMKAPEQLQTCCMVHRASCS